MELQIPRDQGIRSGQEVYTPADQVLGSWHGGGGEGLLGLQTSICKVRQNFPKKHWPALKTGVPRVRKESLLTSCTKRTI